MVREAYLPVTNVNETMNDIKLSLFESQKPKRATLKLSLHLWYVDLSVERVTAWFSPHRLIYTMRHIKQIGCMIYRTKNILNIDNSNGL